MMDRPSAPRRVLLFTALASNVATYRLPKVLTEAGFEIAALSQPKSLFNNTRYLQRRFRLNARRFAPIMRADLERAYRHFRPDIIIPCCERAASLVQYWAAKERQAPGYLSPGLLACLGRSVGQLETLNARAMKSETQKLARSLGLRTPRETTVHTLEAAREAASQYGYPVMLKLSHGAGGQGVRLCRDEAALAQSFAALSVGPSPIKAFRRKLLHLDWFPSRSNIAVQEFISGTPAMTCAAAVAGKTVGVISAFASQTTGPTGQASVVRLAPHEGMVRASAVMIEAFGAAGLISFDFVVDEAGREYLLECNPRPTQVLHLGGLVAVDLPKRLLDALNGIVRDSPEIVGDQEARIAIFPAEWNRDPASPALRDSHHDVPWDDPDLIRAMLRKRPRNWRGRPIP
jgi:predicted ATP-grasp superfamily ATP-dependent carboligase